MLSHPDPQIQYIFSALENQRDSLMIENGTLAARIKAMEEAAAADAQQPVAPPKDAAPEELTLEN